MPSPEDVLATRIHQLKPFRDLDSGDRIRLASTVAVRHLKPHDTIFARDVNNQVFYLCSGQLELRYQYLPEQILSETSSEALWPLFNEGEEPESCLQAVTESTLWVFDRKLFNRVIEKEALVDERLLSQHMGHVELNIYNAMLEAVESGKLKLPSLPEVAVRIRKAIEQEDVKIAEVSKIVELDPALSARLIKVANSALNRGVNPIRSMRDVIVRLGLKVTRNLVISFCMAQLFKSRHGLLKRKMQGFYEHSVEIAAIAFALGEHIKHLDTDQLLLAGLIHDIGVIPVITYIDKTGLEFSSEDEIDQLIRALRVAAGVLVVKSWNLPAEMLQVVSHAEHWHRDNGDRLQLVDGVVIAQIYSMLQHKDTRHLPDLERVPALKKLSKGRHDPVLAMGVLDQARDEIEQIRQLLSDD